MQAGLCLKQTVSTDQCKVEINTELTQVIPASLLPLSDVDNFGTAFRRRTTGKYMVDRQLAQYFGLIVFALHVPFEYSDCKYRYCSVPILQF